jgi:hypothetical protein
MNHFVDRVGLLQSLRDKNGREKSQNIKVKGTTEHEAEEEEEEEEKGRENPSAGIIGKGACRESSPTVAETSKGGI